MNTHDRPKAQQPTQQRNENAIKREDCPLSECRVWARMPVSNIQCLVISLVVLASQVTSY